MNSSNTIINPKSCSYGCGVEIYWNTEENAYFEVFSGNRHQCPNRQQQQQQSNYNNKKATSSSSLPSQTTTKNKPSYYSTNNKKSYYSNYKPKPKMSNSLELLQGHI